MTSVRFYDQSFVPGQKVTYSVIAARFDGRWIFVRHHDRLTWEIAGGHIEANETPSDTARRELAEETGAREFSLDCVATYSVEKDGGTDYGRLFFAEVTKPGTLPENSEIAETAIMDDLPGKLTYPDIQPHMFRKVIEFLEGKDS